MFRLRMEVEVAVRTTWSAAAGSAWAIKSIRLGWRLLHEDRRTTTAHLSRPELVTTAEAVEASLLQAGHTPRHSTRSQGSSNRQINTVSVRQIDKVDQTLCSNRPQQFVKPKDMAIHHGVRPYGGQLWNLAPEKAGPCPAARPVGLQSLKDHRPRQPVSPFEPGKSHVRELIPQSS